MKFRTITVLVNISLFLHFSLTASGQAAEANKQRNGSDSDKRGQQSKGSEKVDTKTKSEPKSNEKKVSTVDHKSGDASKSSSDAEQKENEKEWHEYLAESQKLYADGKIEESFDRLELGLGAAERLKADGNKTEAFLKLGEQYLYLKKYEKAKTLMEEGLKLKRKIPGFKSSSSANSLDNLAQAYARTGDLQSAETMEKEALDIYQSLHKENTHDYAIALSNHANTLRQLKNYKDAEQFFAKAVATQQKLDGANGDSEELAKILLNAGGLYCEMNKLDSAKRLLDRASKIIRVKFKPQHPLYLLSVKSERVYNKKLVDSLLKTDKNPYRPEVAQAIISLASLYEQEDDISQAAEAYKQAIAIEQQLEPGSAELNRIRDAYANCMKKLAN